MTPKPEPTPPPSARRKAFGDSSRGLEDLAPRLLAAGVLIPAAIGAAIVGGPWLAAACGAAAAAMAFEWARMSARDRLEVSFIITLLAALGAIAAATWLQTTLALAWIASWAFVAAVMRAGAVRPMTQAAEAAFGVFYIGLPLAGFLWLRQDSVGGPALTLGLFFTVWAADAAAYFGGRIVGGPKLHPGISPNKTWAGVGAGVVAGCAAGLGCAAIFGADFGVWAIAGAVLGAASMAGDLLESLLKRRFGVKDASGLIPGHGGALDRLDGLMAASVVAAIAVLAHPGLAVALSGQWR